MAAGTAHYPALEAIRVLFGHDRPMYKGGRVANWTHSADHGPFHDAGVPFIYFGVEDHADYHQPTDTADRIQPGVLGEVGNFVLSVMRELDSMRR